MINCKVCGKPYEHLKAREGGWDDRTCSPGCARELETQEKDTVSAIKRAEIAAHGGPPKE